ANHSFFSFFKSAKGFRIFGFWPNNRWIIFGFRPDKHWMLLGGPLFSESLQSSPSNHRAANDNSSSQTSSPSSSGITSIPQFPKSKNGAWVFLFSSISRKASSDMAISPIDD